MPKQTLDKVLKEKVEPLLDNAMHKYLGATVSEISEDISDKIEKSPLITYEINTEVSFRSAKKIFRKEFLKRLLQSNLGNVSIVAKITGMDRRSIHRAIKDLDIDITRIRKDLIPTKYYQKEAVGGIVKDTLDGYKTIIQPSRLENMYSHIIELSENIVRQLPVLEMRWDDAEIEFEKEYLKKALKDNDNSITKTAKKVGLRYETLHRKLKKLGLR